MMMVRFCLFAAVAPILAVCRLRAPPNPVGTPIERAKDGAYATKGDACASCKYSATGSCAMYKSCTCYSTNSFFGDEQKATDSTNFHWACGNEGGDMYELCFAVDETYQDLFGDKIDPNNPKCPE